MNLPLIEDIYDFETDQLQHLHDKIKAALEQNTLPDGWESLEKFQKKARKLLQPLELQLHQRQQLDNILDFFLKAQIPQWADSQQAPQPTVSSASTNCDSLSKSSRLTSDENSANYMTPTSRQSEYEETKSEFSVKESTAVSSAGWKTKSSAKGKKKMADIMREKLAKTRITQQDGGDAITVGRSSVPTAPRLPLAPRQGSTLKQSSTKNSSIQVHKKTVQRQRNTMTKQLQRSGSQKKKKLEQTTKITNPRELDKIQQKPRSMAATPSKEIHKQAQSKKNRVFQPKQTGFKNITSMSIEPEQSKKVLEELKSTEVENSTKVEDNVELKTDAEQKDHKQEQAKEAVQVKKEENSQGAKRKQEVVESFHKQEVKQQVKQQSQRLVEQNKELKGSCSSQQLKNKESFMDQKVKVNEEKVPERKQKIIEEVEFQQVPQEIDPPSPPAKEVREEIKVESQEIIEKGAAVKPIQISQKKMEYFGQRIKQSQKKQKKKEERVQRVPEILKLIERTQALSAQNKTHLQQLSQIQKSAHQVEIKEPEISSSTKRKEMKKVPSRVTPDINSGESQKEKQQHFEEKMAKYLKEEQLLKSTSQDQKKSKKREDAKEDQQSTKKKPVKAKSKIASIQKALEDPNIVDYSKYYKCFNEIFSCFQSSPKNFDAPVLYRDTRNMYQNFIALMDSSCLFFNKHQFQMDPISQAQQKSMMFTNHLLMAQKNFSDKELEIKNSDNELMMMAMQQAQIQEKYQQLKDSPDSKLGTQQALENQVLIVPNRQPTLYFRVIKNKAEVYEIITMAFHRKKRWNELPHGVDLRHSWNLLWSWSKSKIDHNKLLAWQRINHFQQSKNVSRKDFLKKNIERVQKLSAKCASVFNIMPATFVLPKEYVNFVEEYTRVSQYEGKYNFWIVKPCAMSRGRGISLIDDISVSYVDPVIVQKYVRNPLLLNGFKFDLRIYVVVTSVNPLEIFIYKQGFARFSTKPYSISPEDIKNKFIHLTNSSVNKNNNCSELDQTDQLYGGTKIDLKTLRDRLQAKKISWDRIWAQVCQIVVKSFAACQNDIPYNPSCFELFGYDIIIDDNLKCWLIEINSSPSLGRMNLLDDMVKQRLIDDTIDLMECVDFDRKRLVEVLERRIGQEGRATGPTFGGLKQMNRDLTYILNGTVPRKYGEMPRFLGNFERIAPTSYSQKIIRLIGGQKMFGSQSKVLNQMERSDSKMSLGG